jgi:hypothetical protein
MMKLETGGTGVSNTWNTVKVSYEGLFSLLPLATKQPEGVSNKANFLIKN